MKLLKELLEMHEDNTRIHGFDIIEEKMKEMKSILSTLISEGFVDEHRGDLEKEFDELEKKYIAARRALGTINRGAKNISPNEVKVHRSKIMQYLNNFRNRLQNVMLELNMTDREIEYHMNRMDDDRRFGRPSEVFNKPVQPALRGERSRSQDSLGNNQRRVA